MSRVSLFRKWRSQRFQDLVGQAAVVRTLKNALTSGTPARAYLFCGPRGTGKTSTARIFAKALNCEQGPAPEPCNECSLCRRITEGSCIDVMEVDAASHTQVDKVREFIVEKVQFAPVEARVKVYIIDEVHKLSTSSFNALLKTLEEPPPHVVFILATTHPHELLPTILSRCQRHDFRRLSVEQIRGHLIRVARGESIQLEPQAAELLARSADGSLRDALVLLEQAALYSGSVVTEREVRSLLGLAGRQAMARFVDVLARGKTSEALELLAELSAEGRDLRRLALELIEHLRQLLLLAVGAPDSGLRELPEGDREELQAQVSAVSTARIMSWIRAFMDLGGEARDPAYTRLWWEMTLIRLTRPTADPGLDGLVSRVERLEALVGATSGGEESTRKESGERSRGLSSKGSDTPRMSPPPARSSHPSRGKLPPEQLWPALMQRVRESDMRLHAVLVDAVSAQFRQGRLEVEFPHGYRWHQETVAKNRPLLESLAGDLLGEVVALECRVGGEVQSPSEGEEHEALVRRAEGLFSGKVVEEW